MKALPFEAREEYRASKVARQATRAVDCFKARVIVKTRNGAGEKRQCDESRCMMRILRKFMRLARFLLAASGDVNGAAQRSHEPSRTRRWVSVYHKEQLKVPD